VLYIRLVTHAESTSPSTVPALSPEALHAIGAEAWPLLPVFQQDRAGVDWPEASLLVDRLIVKVARASGAIAIAMGECLDHLCQGDGTMRLGYSNLGDYAREELSLPARTARELAQLARELRARPILRQAVRAGVVGTAQAMAVMPLAIGDAELGWVERATRGTVRALRVAVNEAKDAKAREEREGKTSAGPVAAANEPAEGAASGGAYAERAPSGGAKAAAWPGDASAPEADVRFEKLGFHIEPEDRAAVNEALEIAGRLLRATSPVWQRIEIICQEYLGSHPLPEDVVTSRFQLPASGARVDGAPENGSTAPQGGALPAKEQADLLAWLEAEHDRWSWLFQADPVPAPEAGVDARDQARMIDERLKELAAMRAGWDQLLGHLSMLVVNLGVWRVLGFADLDHYAAERLGLSGRAIEQRAWLERRLWNLPPLREAVREGRVGYERARLLARCDGVAGGAGGAGVEKWIARSQSMTVIELSRALDAEDERKMSARKELVLRLPADVRRLFDDGCKAVLRAEGRILMTTGECLAAMCRHFVETYADEARWPNTPAGRSMARDGGLCTCPGCSWAADHSHHVVFRSQGGSDEEWNRTSLCMAHHLRGVHEGFVRVRGSAPEGLEWRLGERG
jgi:hypothetical protein